jgi:hypothetical protein
MIIIYKIIDYISAFYNKNVWAKRPSQQSPIFLTLLL